MIKKLQEIEDKFIELEHKIGDPKIIENQSEWQKQTKAHSKFVSLIDKFREYKKVLQGIDEAHELLKEKIEDEFKEMVQCELNELKLKYKQLEDDLKVLLISKDSNDDKNVIVEIRGGTGGDEAALFAGNLFRMYMRYAERRNWKTEILSSNPTDLGGFKEVVFVIEGVGSYSRLKFESGVHRVQRVPETESNGRIHTSTVTVAVLAEAKDVDVVIGQGDLRIDTYCASGAGGQHVNKTESAVRITHLPTGIVVQCQDEKSQLKNREKAMRVLRAKILELAQKEQKNAQAENRKSQIGTGDRSERIRTYNFPQGRVSDHRVGLTLYKLDLLLDGDIDDFINALITADQSEQLKKV